MKITRVLLSAKRHWQEGPPFLALFTEREVTRHDRMSLCAVLTEYYQQGGPLFLRDFSEHEIHIYPSPKSTESFMTLNDAIGEFQTVLRILGFTEWINQIALDADIVPLDERVGAPQGGLCLENSSHL